MQRAPLQRLPGKQANLFVSNSPADGNLRNRAALCQAWPCDTVSCYSMPCYSFHALTDSPPQFHTRLRDDMELPEQYLLTSMTIERLLLLLPDDLLIVLIMSDSTN